MGGGSFVSPLASHVFTFVISVSSGAVSVGVKVRWGWLLVPWIPLMTLFAIDVGMVCSSNTRQQMVCLVQSFTGAVLNLNNISLCYGEGKKIEPERRIKGEGYSMTDKY